MCDGGGFEPGPDFPLSTAALTAFTYEQFLG